MTNTHHLEKELHSEFLKQGRIDPITGEEIEEGHTIVICSACKSAFFIESWQYLGETHCNQSETLLEIPKSKNMFLKAKPLEYLPFLFKKGNYQNDDAINNVLENFLLIIISFVGIFSLFFIAVIIGYYSTPLFGLLGGFGLAGLIALVLNTQKSTTLLKAKASPKKASYLALHTKKQAIAIKKKKNEQIIPFEQIDSLKYFFDYVRANNKDELHTYSLSLEIILKNKEKATYYTVLNKEQIPYWSEFLENLPYGMKVLNIR